MLEIYPCRLGEPILSKAIVKVPWLFAPQAEIDKGGAAKEKR